MVCLILGLVTLPVEALILPIASTPDAEVAALEYVETMSPAELDAAAADLSAFPSVYRRAIMGELTPERRAEVWRAQLQLFLDSHRELTPGQAAVVRDAMALLTPAAVRADVSAEIRAQMGATFTKAVAELGPQTAGQLFVTLGPKAGTRASVLPFMQRLADQVRSWRVATAVETPCICNMSFDTCDLVPDPWLQCTETYSCTPDVSWPMCGPFWSWACNGWCRMLRQPGGGEGDGREGTN
jgi:hypothetical protein